MEWQLAVNPLLIPRVHPPCRKFRCWLRSLDYKVQRSCISLSSILYSKFCRTGHTAIESVLRHAVLAPKLKSVTTPKVEEFFFY
jgi:hypothetical protein